MLTKTRIVAALVAMLLAPASAQNNPNKLPEIGTAGSSVLTVEKEQQIGEVVMMQIRAGSPVITDPLIDEYINDLGNKLVVNAQDVRYKFEFFVIQNPEINAFAAFGGKIGMHTGTILSADTESELASVIGHEIAHATQRHLARGYEAQQRNSPLTIAGMISSLLLALADPQAGMAGFSATMAGTQQASINYTRSNEKEADRIGIATLANSGFDPYGAPAFFTKMAERYRYKSLPPPMLLTHPLSEARISEARIRAEQFSPVNVPPSLSFHLVRARIQARYQGDAEDNIAMYNNMIKKNRYVLKEEPLYGLALSHLALRQHDEAMEIIEDLLEQHPKNLYFIDTYTDIAQAINKPQLAITKLAEMYKLMPNNQVVTFNYANTLIMAGELDHAIELLKQYVIVKGNNMLAFDMLISAYRKKNDNINLHESKGQRLAFAGAFQQAIDEYQTALQFASSAKETVTQDRLKARIAQVRAKEERINRLSL